MRLLQGCTRWGAVHPIGSATADGKRCIRSGRAQYSLMGARPDRQQEAARIHVRGSSAPANRYDTTRHATGQMPVTALLTEAR